MRTSPFRPFYNRKIKEFAKQMKPGIVLEVGAAHLSYASTANKCKSFSIDITKNASLSAAADITCAPFRTESFDYVFCINVLEHVYDFNKALSEMHRILKKSGTLLIISPFMFPVHDSPNDFHRFTEHALRKMLKDFANIKIELTPSLPGLFRRFAFFYFVKAKK